MKATWLANQASRTVQVVNAFTDFVPLAWNPEDMQMVEARRFTLNEMGADLPVAGGLARRDRFEPQILAT